MRHGVLDQDLSDTQSMKRRRRRAAPQDSLPFKWPVPDVSMLGDHQRDISARYRDAIDKTLPPEIDRKKLWTHLEPVIKETRTPKQIVEMLESRIRALELSAQVLIALDDGATAKSLQDHITWLRDALRYYKNLTGRHKAGRRWKMFQIARAWCEAGGSLTISTPDDPHREKGGRRGRGKPSGPLIDYFVTASGIICDEALEPTGVKTFLYRNYKQHFHFQPAGDSHAGQGGLGAAVAILRDGKLIP